MMGQYTNSVLAKREAKLGRLRRGHPARHAGLRQRGLGREYLHRQEGSARHAAAVQLHPRRHHPRHRPHAGARRGHPGRRGDRVTRDELYLADEAFFTGTAAEVTPVREVDNRAIGAGKVGPITKRLQARYFDVVKGSDNHHPEWHTKV